MISRETEFYEKCCNLWCTSSTADFNVSFDIYPLINCGVWICNALAFHSYCKWREIYRDNYKMQPHRRAFHSLYSFHKWSLSQVVGLRLKIVSLMYRWHHHTLFLPPLCVSACFSIWGNGTLKQQSVAGRLTSTSSKHWTTLGSSWRRQLTTHCCWPD